MARKPLETRIRVWREFGSGMSRGVGRPPGEIISMVFLHMAPVSEAFGFPHPMNKGSRGAIRDWGRSKFEEEEDILKC